MSIDFSYDEIRLSVAPAAVSAHEHFCRIPKNIQFTKRDQTQIRWHSYSIAFDLLPRLKLWAFTSSLCNPQSLPLARPSSVASGGLYNDAVLVFHRVSVPMSDASNSHSPDDTDKQDVQYDPDDDSYHILQCTDCDTTVLAIGRDDPPMSCHDEPMEHIHQVNMTVKTPDIREVLFEAFGLPKSGLDICLCVIGDGPLSASEVAAKLDYDRTTVTRYLNKLVDLGLLRRSELNREDGGIINAYHSVDLEQMRRETLTGFYLWAGEAATLIENANTTKQEYFEENPDHELPEVFWESFSEK